MSESVKHDSSTRDSYLDLVKNFPLVSIQSDKALSRAQAMADSLFAKGALDRGEETYLDALSDLIAIYEDEHVVIEHPGDSAVLAHLMEANRINQTRLSQETGIAKSTLSEVLSGVRDLTRPQVAKLAAFFNVGQGVFALPSPQHASR